MTTVWSLQGQPDVYSGSLVTTDGYMITSYLTWRSMVNTQSLTDGTTTVTMLSNDPSVIGTCVETLDSEGEALAARVTT